MEFSGTLEIQHTGDTFIPEYICSNEPLTYLTLYINSKVIPRLPLQFISKIQIFPQPHQFERPEPRDEPIDRLVGTEPRDEPIDRLAGTEPRDGRFRHAYKLPWFNFKQCPIQLFRLKSCITKFVVEPDAEYILYGTFRMYTIPMGIELHQCSISQYYESPVFETDLKDNRMDLSFIKGLVKGLFFENLDISVIEKMSLRISYPESLDPESLDMGVFSCNNSDLQIVTTKVGDLRYLPLDDRPFDRMEYEGAIDFTTATKVTLTFRVSVAFKVYCITPNIMRYASGFGGLAFPRDEVETEG